MMVHTAEKQQKPEWNINFLTKIPDTHTSEHACSALKHLQVLEGLLMSACMYTTNYIHSVYCIHSVCRMCKT